MYGSVDQVIARTAATPETLGFEDASNPEQELRDFVTTNLEQASDAINRYCHTTFELQQNQTESRWGNDSITIQLDHGPIDTINSVEEDDETLSEGDDFKIVTNDLGENNAVLKRLENGEEPLTERWRSHHRYSFDYDWGYPQGEWPGVLDSVANELVINRLNEAAAERAASGLQSLSMDGYSVDYAVVDAAQKGEITDAQLSRLKDLREPKIA